MWLPLTVLLLAGIVSADYDHGWHVGNEYTYLVRSRTLATLNELSDQHTGMLMKALLTIQVKDPQMLTAKLSRSEYARIHKSLPEGWDTEISDQMLELRDMPLSGKPFGIKLKHGVIRDIIVDRTTPTWEVNILKSIISQLQVDSLGENAIRTVETQIPTDNQPHGLFRAMEDSVGGKCEVLYDITPLSEQVAYNQPELVPIPKLKGDGQNIDIRKSKNFDKCDQRMSYQFGMTDNKYWEAGSNKNGKFFSQSATSRIIISGTLKSFTIQSAVTTNLMYISPRLYDYGHGLVASRMNLTLATMKRITSPLSKPKNLESTGNLVYTYNNPFLDTEERRVGNILEDSDNMFVSDSISSISSSEEATKGQNLRSLSSDSSSSSSSISSSEEDHFWQPKPTLEDAPQNPLLPLFIGYNGKYIGKSNKVDVVANSKELISQIANEMEDPNDVYKNQLLEKFTILSDLLRTMNKEQLLQVDKDMRLSPHEMKSIDKTLLPKQNAWNVLKSAIAQIGTGPALLVIKNWIETKEIDSATATYLLARIPKTARAPTAEYIKELFKLATGETVKNDPAIGGAAIIALSELIHNAQVSRKGMHNNYPVHAFGRLTSKHDQVVTEYYIPYLEKELKKAVESGQSTIIQTYIMALGNIGHPKILPVFEPYLEGKMQVTVFQRTLMVSALAKLAENYPKLARSILYKIYLNTMEEHEVRCTAVFILMTTDPPLTMLQRMAEYTKVDRNKHVNSAVKSTLESLAELKSPEYQTLAKKARAAKNLLSPNDYSYHYSHGYATESITDGGNIISHMILKYIGSDESLIPTAIYYAMYSSYGDFKLPPFEVITMVSSIRSILELNTSPKEKEGIRLAAEKIAEELNIIPDAPIPLEGNIIWNEKFTARFLPFDKTSFTLLHELLMMYTNGEQEGKLNRLQSYEVTFGFPTETGLPFVYSFEIPTLFKITAAMSNEAKNLKTMKMKTDFRMLYAMKMQGRFGIVTPFDYQHYIAGVDLGFNLHLPMKLTLGLDLFKHSLEIKMWPLKGEDKARLLHYSVVPYIASHNILNLRPLLTEKTTQTLIPDDTYSDSTSDSNLMKVEVELDKYYDHPNWFNMDIDDLSDSIMTPWISDNNNYREINIFLNLEREQVAPLAFKISYDSMEMEPTAADTKLWTPKATAMEPLDKESDSEARRKQWMDEAAKGIKSAKSQVIDIQIEIPMTSDEGIENIITIAMSHSEVEKKERMLLYWSLKTLFEICAASQTKVTPDNTMFYDQVTQLKPKVEFNADLRVGKVCSTGEQMNINGEATQSKELRERIKNSSLIKTCQKQMQQGNKILRACQNAAAISMILDQITVSIDFQSQFFVNLITKILTVLINTDYFEEYADIHTQFLDPKITGRKKIDITANLTDDLERADVLISTPAMTVYVNDIDLSAFEISSEDVLMAADEDMDIQNLLYNEDEPACILDKTRAQTFDSKEYPLRLGNCWHVVMTTYPRANPDKPDEKMRMNKFDSVSILIRETENGQREMKVLLGDKEIKFIPTPTQIQVYVNEQPVKITKDMAWQERKDGEILFEIFQISDQFIGLVSDEYELNLVYDGIRIMVKAGDKFRKAIRGLCGNYDGEPINDFTAPRSCILRKPELFIASYALTKDQCEGESLENSKLLTDRDCIRDEKSHLSNVISDKESGRRDTEESNWGYHKKSKIKQCIILKTHIMERDNEICFTIRQVPSCTPGCTATEMKPKDYQYHCMKKDRASLALKDRINKGAKPDLSQKSVTTTETIDVPLDCKA